MLYGFHYVINWCIIIKTTCKENIKNLLSFRTTVIGLRRANATTAWSLRQPGHWNHPSLPPRRRNHQPCPSPRPLPRPRPYHWPWPHPQPLPRPTPCPWPPSGPAHAFYRSFLLLRSSRCPHRSSPSQPAAGDIEVRVYTTWPHRSKEKRRGQICKTPPLQQQDSRPSGFGHIKHAGTTTGKQEDNHRKQPSGVSGYRLRHYNNL